MEFNRKFLKKTGEGRKFDLIVDMRVMKIVRGISDLSNSNILGSRDAI